MAKIAYFDCFSGASGDMLLGALLDAGADFSDLQADLALLGLSDYEVRVTPTGQHGIQGSKFDVIDAGHERPARNLHLVEHVIGDSALPEEVKAASLWVFTRLAEAEARVHGTTIQDVHFHEVGAVDSLVDIVGFCAVMHRQGIEALYASPLPVGHGHVRTEHGLLPLPVPATLALLADAGAPVEPRDIEMELVTPTGAAILTTLAQFSRPAMKVQRVGYGFGSRTLPWPNMLRAWLGESVAVGAHAGAPHGDHEHHHEPAADHSHDHEHHGEHAHLHEHAHDHEPSHAHGHAHDHGHPQGHDDSEAEEQAQ
jgi:hypothetical protein